LRYQLCGPIWKVPEATQAHYASVRLKFAISSLLVFDYAQWELQLHYPSRRPISTCPVDAENIGFPMAAQAAMLVRQRKGCKDEIVALVTSLAPEELDAKEWLLANRQAWGIENGLHQRLDISLNDDRCRVRNAQGLWVLGMFRRLANSLFMQWRTRQPNAKYKTTTDFQTVMGADNLAKALRLVTSKRPAL
jgi:hypothetical protein